MKMDLDFLSGWMKIVVIRSFEVDLPLAAGQCSRLWSQNLLRFHLLLILPIWRYFDLAINRNHNNSIHHHHRNYGLRVRVRPSRSFLTQFHKEN